MTSFYHLLEHTQTLRETYTTANGRDIISSKAQTGHRFEGDAGQTSVDNVRTLVVGWAGLMRAGVRVR